MVPRPWEDTDTHLPWSLPSFVASGERNLPRFSPLRPCGSIHLWQGSQQLPRLPSAGKHSDVGKNHRNIRPGFESRLYTWAVITYVKHKPSNWAFTSSSVPWIELQTVFLILKCLVLEKLFFLRRALTMLLQLTLNLPKAHLILHFF